MGTFSQQGVLSSVLCRLPRHVGDVSGCKRRKVNQRVATQEPLLPTDRMSQKGSARNIRSFKLGSVTKGDSLEKICMSGLTLLSYFQALLALGNGLCGSFAVVVVAAPGPPQQRNVKIAAHPISWSILKYCEVA